MELIDPKATDYAEKFTSTAGDLLQTIAMETANGHAQAHMLSGQVQGKFLELITTVYRPLRILEIGTFTGYSAICMAKALPAHGKLHTIERREADAATARFNFTRAGLEDNIILHTGNALDIIATIEETWDMVFLDADKTNYIAYYEMVLPKLKKGGLIIADNVLFHGQVLEEMLTGKNAKAIHAFNEHVFKDNRTEQVMLTVRDGLLFIVKK